MNTKISIFIFITATAGFMIFSSFGIACLFRKMRWPADLLAFTAAAFVLLVGICMGAWSVAVREEHKEKVEAIRSRTDAKP